MAKTEAGLSKEQQGLLMGAVDFLDKADFVKKKYSGETIMFLSAETESGIEIRWGQTTPNYAFATGSHFGSLVLELVEEDAIGEIHTIIDFEISGQGASCRAKEVVEPYNGGVTDRTVKRIELDNTVRKMGKLLNRVYN